MAKARVGKASDLGLPGCMYLRKGKYWWWKVRLPGEDEPTGRPLTPPGGTVATTEFTIAGHIANDMLEKATLSEKKTCGVYGGSIAELIKLFLAEVDEIYKAPSAEPKAFRTSYKELLSHYGVTRAESFTSSDLELIRDKIKDRKKRKITRNTYLKNFQKIMRFFQWARDNRKIPSLVLADLQTVNPLASEAGLLKSEIRKPIDPKFVRVVFPFTRPQIVAMLELQLHIGMRSEEVCLMRLMDIDMSGKAWIYAPSQYKTKRLYKETKNPKYIRLIPLGPKCQNILEPFLQNREPDQFLFSPKEAETIRLAQITIHGRGAKYHKGNKMEVLNDYYTSSSYLQEIEYPCPDDTS